MCEQDEQIERNRRIGKAIDEFNLIPLCEVTGCLWTRPVIEMDQGPEQAVVADVIGRVKFGEKFTYALGYRGGEYGDPEDIQLVVVPNHRVLHFES
jgi:hypothetical protein